ncbi:MAG: class B sortase [Oscillospiraceae bacterium]|nr:class B sortase [Oscillospiraceae bacterium]
MGKTKKRKKKKKKSGLLKAVRIIAIIVIALCAGYIGWWLINSARLKNASQEAARLYTSEAEALEGEDSSGFQVDFTALKEVSEDVAAWIRMPGIEVIDYPVVHYNDEYYLNHSWQGEYSAHGAIFIEEINSPDFTDYHTVIYGHKMLDGSMFGSLRSYEDAEYYVENGGLIYIYTPETSLTYEIFAVEYVTAADPVVYTVFFSPGEEYTAFLSAMSDRAIYDTGVSVSDTDRVLTLSTCSQRENVRFTVHAKLIEGEP